MKMCWRKVAGVLMCCYSKGKKQKVPLDEAYGIPENIPEERIIKPSAPQDGENECGYSKVKKMVAAIEEAQGMREQILKEGVIRPSAPKDVENECCYSKGKKQKELLGEAYGMPENTPEERMMKPSSSQDAENEQSSDGTSDIIPPPPRIPRQQDVLVVCIVHEKTIDEVGQRVSENTYASETTTSACFDLATSQQDVSTSKFRCCFGKSIQDCPAVPPVDYPQTTGSVDQVSPIPGQHLRSGIVSESLSKDKFAKKVLRFQVPLQGAFERISNQVPDKGPIRRGYAVFWQQIKNEVLLPRTLVDFPDLGALLDLVVKVHRYHTSPFRIKNMSTMKLTRSLMVDKIQNYLYRVRQSRRPQTIHGYQLATPKDTPITNNAVSVTPESEMATPSAIASTSSDNRVRPEGEFATHEAIASTSSNVRVRPVCEFATAEAIASTSSAVSVAPQITPHSCPNCQPIWDDLGI